MSASAPLRGRLQPPLWWWWLAAGQWRQSPGRALTCVLSIAIGVALALGIHLINDSALEEFRQAMATVNGESHAQLRATRESIPEELWIALVNAAPQGLESASPGIDAEVRIDQARGPMVRMRLLGLDVLAASAVTPGLLPGVATPALLEPDTVALSVAARRALSVAEGDTVRLHLGGLPVALRVVGTLPDAAGERPLAVMDLGNAQWRLDRVGLLSRIDLRLSAGADALALRTELNAAGRGQWIWSTAEDSAQRMSNLSRAYRVNLSVLALVALFTGAFLVFSTLALAVARQTPELALLGVLGASAMQRAGAVLTQGLLLGSLGALLGVLAGLALAQGVLLGIGADLGGGYFEGARPVLHADPVTLLGFGLLGVLTGALGSWAPARAVARMPAARTLRSAGADLLLRGIDRPRLAAVLGLGGLGLLALPAIAGLPLPAYGAIALWLLAGITSLPTWIRQLARVALSWQARSGAAARPSPAVSWLAMHRAAQAPGAIAAGLSGVVASVALASAMGIMVHSFRESVSQWLDQVLPAPLYARLPNHLNARLQETDLAAVRKHPEVARVQAMRTIELQAGPGEPTIALLVRHSDPSAPLTELPLTGPGQPAPAGLTPVLISEPLARRWSLQAGDRVSLDPIRPDPQGSLFVEGVWRDYARQHGAIAIDGVRWHALTGEHGLTDLAVWPTASADADTLPERLRGLSPALQPLEWRSAQEIRALSLRIFDRSFAVTYALEAIALLVGLFGVAAACASDALSRMREFGMLRHIGLGARDAARQIVLESVLGTAVAIVWGITLGVAIGWVLIAWVNPQSFHWTMQMHIPWSLLGLGALGLLAGAALSARWAGRSALSQAPLAAVRQDT